MKLVCNIILVCLLTCWSLYAQERVFKPTNPDFKLSPETGMTRQHWKDAALYILEGAFSHVNTIDDPMKFPKQPGKSYPRDGVTTPTELLEGLTRTLFIASPLLKENPNLTIKGISVADYYRRQISKLVDENSPSFTKKRAQNGGPSQILVEYGALSLSLFLAEDVLWKPLPQQTKDALAATMLSYGDGPTIEMNWRFFNVFILSFYKKQGYEVNEGLLVNLLEKCLKDYVGQGWYTDSPYFDYYSMWGFQMFGGFWAQSFGKDYYPEIAAKYFKNLEDLAGTYPQMYGKDGHMIMWGRSISYRFGVASPFPLMGFLDSKSINYGWLRRISSSTLLQFLENPNFLEDRVPTLGFYGPFEPAVQQYSCRGSVYWMGKLFLTAFLLPEDNVFWTAKENNGDWEKYKDKEVYNFFAEGSGTLVSNYPAIGGSEVRAWCYSEGVGYYQGTENYNKLAYSSVFPWMADGKDGLVSMNYAFNYQNMWESARMYTFKKYDNGVYYRDIKMSKDHGISMKLADITLPNGILRVDQYTGNKDAPVGFGSYSLPDKGKGIKSSVQQINDYTLHIIDNGTYQIAMIPVKGWTALKAVETKGLHPEAEIASFISGKQDLKANSNSYLISLQLWKKSGEKWTKNDVKVLKGLQEGTNGVNVPSRKLQVSFDK